ncbi:HAD family hydrolase [Paractinoplanes toevensis]|uniref:Phosphoserine phosphatase SerB n=1 Tax=Paractinoplanes toevensis TaxID=571911 RepID=A0A919WDP2_9ACTN|nr:haloacid dehalogenase-like hydrolase [Actinoplanes toevensis]GIM98185.1 phosphoserine phosphatase SerB [Actinoplanes toevensis]
MTRGAVFFDVDGTLVPRTSSGRHLAGFLGHADINEQVEAGYGDGSLTSAECAVLDARGWAGRTPGQVDGFLATLPLLDGIAETVRWCRAHDLVPVLATLAWDAVGAHLCGRFDFDRASGPSLEVIDGCYSGAVATQFDEMDKRAFALGVAASLGVDPARCAAVGDGRSDVPLFGAVGYAIALNGTPAARAAAHVSIEATDLRAVIPYLASLCSP